MKQIITSSSHFIFSSFHHLTSFLGRQVKSLNQYLLASMKPIILSLLLIYTSIIQAQSFGTLSTEWKHSYIPHFEIPITYVNIKASSTAEFRYNDLACNTISITDAPNGFSSMDSIVICRENERVFYMDDDSLHLLYDFSLNAGDAYKVRYPINFDSTYKAYMLNNGLYTTVHIDSISTINIDGILLLKQHIHHEGDPAIKLGEYALQRIGYENWILPYISFDNLDSRIFSGLCSYRDKEIEFKDDSSRCFRTSIDNINPHKPQIVISPNPSNDYFFVTVKNRCRITKWQLYNVSGTIIDSKKVDHLQKFKIDCRDNMNGIFLLKLQLDNGREIFTKLMKY